MSEAKHTGHVPTPYHVRPDDDTVRQSDGYIVAIAFDGLHHKADPNLEVGKVTAQFIVRACNAHDELLAVAKLLDAMWTSDFPAGPDSELREGCRFSDDTLEVWRAARAAISSATGAPQ